jgi:hypothetical protein
MEDTANAAPLPIKRETGWIHVPRPMTLLFMMSLSGNKHATSYEAANTNRNLQLSTDSRQSELMRLDSPRPHNFLEFANWNHAFFKIAKTTLFL